MQYKLLFIKTHASHQIAGVGVGGSVLMVFSMLSNMTDGDTLFVDMETNVCFCTEKDAIDGTKNPWEYYFYQKPIDVNKEVDTRTIQETGKVNFGYDDRSIGQNLSLYTSWKNRFYNNFKIKPVLGKLIDDYYNTYISGKTTLGVQVRLTDQQYHHNTKGVDESISRVMEILSENPVIEQVFLATDDSLAIPIIEEALPVPVIYLKDIFRADATRRNTDPHDKLYHDRKLHRYLSGIECLQDIFLLSKCNYLLKADLSSISIAACMFAENIKKVYML